MCYHRFPHGRKGHLGCKPISTHSYLAICLKTKETITTGREFRSRKDREMPKTSCRSWHGLWKTWLAQGAVFGRGRSRGSTEKHRNFARSTDIFETENPGANSLSSFIIIESQFLAPTPGKYSWIPRVFLPGTHNQAGNCRLTSGASHIDLCSEVAPLGAENHV